MRLRSWYNSAVRTKPVSSPLRLVALTLSLALATACARRPAPDPAYVAELEAWRAKRLASLTADEGWLTLVGLAWLKPGTNRFGSAPGNEVVLPGAGIPPVAGLLDLADGAVTLRASAEAGVLVNDVPTTEQWLATDRSGRADVVRLGSLRFHVIVRADRFGVRIKDPDNRARREFPGIEQFPIDPAARVQGAFERYPAPREVTVASAHGPDQQMLVTGVVHFRIGATECALEPFVGSPEDRHFFFVFRDGTAGVETYGAGRFLDADGPEPGSTTVILDFNRATNPPCAFTPFATCPLPPPQNVLAVRIEAGEKSPPAH